MVRACICGCGAVGACRAGKVLRLRDVLPQSEGPRPAPWRRARPPRIQSRPRSEDPLDLLRWFEEVGIAVRPNGLSIEDIAEGMREGHARRLRRRAEAAAVLAADLAEAAARRDSSKEGKEDSAALGTGRDKEKPGAGSRASGSEIAVPSTLVLPEDDLSEFGALPGESVVQPQARLGVNALKLRFPSNRRDDEDLAERVETERGQYGEYWEILGDVAAVGAGVVRHLADADLLWESLFPAREEYTPGEPDELAEIPAPGDLYRWLTDDHFEAFWRFTLVVVQAAWEGVQVVPTLFTHGGAGRYNEKGYGYFGDDANAIVEGRPSYQASPIVPSGGGWSSYYTNEGRGARSAAQLFFQRYGLSLLWEEDAVDEFEAECARRKCLGLAAYGEAVGAYLAHLEGAFASLGWSFADVVPRLELGNEMDVQWFPGDSDGLQAQEMARFVAVLALSVRQHYPDARFTFGGISSTIATDQSALLQRLGWYRAVVSTLDDENLYWFMLQALTLRYEEDWGEYGGDWPDAWSEGDYLWPPGDESRGLVYYDPEQLLHRLGIHWYHHWNQDPRDFGFLPTSRLGQDTFAAFFWGYAAAHDVEVSETGFPASEPLGSLKGVLYFVDATPRYQAGMLIQRLLTPLAAGASAAFWHTHMAQIWSGGQWTLFTSMGLRNDVEAVLGSGFTQAVDAASRPSWYALRRLAWFLERTSTLEIVHSVSDTGLVLRLRANDRGYRIGGRTWRYAYFVWFGESGDPSVERDPSTVRYFNFTLEGTSEAELLPVIPEVDAAAAGVDDNGFPSAGVNWYWSGWDDVVVAPDLLNDRVIIVVQRSSAAEGRPGVHCLLSDSGESRVPEW